MDHRRTNPVRQAVLAAGSVVRADALVSARRVDVGAGAVNYYHRHIGDYIRDASHLSLLEHGVYTRLLDVYYAREAPIPIDGACRLIGAKAPAEKAATAAVLNEFFTLVDDVWRHGRCDKEIAVAQAGAAKAKESGKIGAAKRWSSKKDGVPIAPPIATPCEPQWGTNGVQIAPNIQYPIQEPRGASAPPGELDPKPADPRKALWELGVSVLGKNARSLIGAAIGRTSEAKVAEVLGFMATKSMADPKAYFSAATQVEQAKSFVC